MPYKLHWTSNCVEWTYYGSLTGAEIIESNNEIYGDSRFDDLHYQIVDLSNVESFGVSETNMKHMAHLDRAAARSNPHIKVAVIAPKGPVLEIADTYARHNTESPWQTAIFDTREEAIA